MCAKLDTSTGFPSRIALICCLLSHSSIRGLTTILCLRSLKRDLSEKRVAAFVKRALQTSSLHSPPFIAAILTAMAELMRASSAFAARVLKTKDNNCGRKSMRVDVDDDDDGEEQFFDVPEDSAKNKSGFV